MEQTSPSELMQRLGILMNLKMPTKFVFKDQSSPPLHGVIREFFRDIDGSGHDDGTIFVGGLSGDEASTINVLLNDTHHADQA